MEEWLNKIHCGDCIEVMNKMPAESIDLIVTSPPYNLRNSTGGGMRNGSGGLWENAALLNGYAGGNTDDMPIEDYVKWQREFLTASMRLLKPGGAIFYNHKWRVQDGLLQDRHDIVRGFPVRQIIIWQRSGGVNFNIKYFLPTYEVIYLICKPEFKLASNDPEHPKAACGVGDIWRIAEDLGSTPQEQIDALKSAIEIMQDRISILQSSSTTVEPFMIGDIWKVSQEFKNGHPAPFPVEIPKRCIESTNTKIVLDPFMGSGSTAIAAKILGVDWIGIEISEEYCKMAEERIANWTPDQYVPEAIKKKTKKAKKKKENPENPEKPV